MRSDSERREDPPEEPGVRRRLLGGVLGHIGGDMGRLHLALEQCDVDLAPPTGDAAGMGDLERTDAGQAGPGQALTVDRRRGPFGSIGPEHGVEVHQSPALELGHLGSVRGGGPWRTRPARSRGTRPAVGGRRWWYAATARRCAHCAARRRHSRKQRTSTVGCRVAPSSCAWRVGRQLSDRPWGQRRLAVPVWHVPRRALPVHRSEAGASQGQEDRRVRSDRLRRRPCRLRGRRAPGVGRRLDTASRTKDSAARCATHTL